MRKFILGLALASSVLAGSAAVAQPAPPPSADRDMPRPQHNGPRGMMRADANRDGVITREEARAEAERMFAERDVNHDGKLTAEEMRPPHDARRGDAPRAGKAQHRAKRDISLAQFERKAMRRFDRIDANKDGRVAKAEIKQHRLERKQHRADRTQQQG